MDDMVDFSPVVDAPFRAIVRHTHRIVLSVDQIRRRLPVGVSSDGHE